MKSRSSTTRSKRRFRRFVLVCQALALVAATGIVSPGCAVQPAPMVPGPTQPAFVESAAEKSTMLTLEYGNRSSKASVQIDLSGTDVQLDMSGSRLPKDTAATSSKSAKAAPSEAASGPASEVADDEGTRKARRLVESTRVQSGDGSDTALRKVVQYIRKSQEMFYAGRYAEADDNARRANELKPTAEGLALAGSISWVRKDRANARRSWLAARDLDPDFPGLAGVLDSAALRQELSP